MKRLALLAAACLLAGTATAQTAPAPAGLWQGSLQAGATKLALFFDLQGAAPALTGTLQVPQQTLQKLPLSTVLVRHDSLLLRADNLRARFAGKFSADGQQVVGTWFQSGLQLPLTLGRGTAEALAAAVPRRPQEPKAPFPYQSQEVRFTNKQASNIALAGTLTLPAGKGPFPAVVLVTGSGPENRDEEVFGHKPFLVLADYLTRRGFAVLRYDDRGVGQSQGTFRGATTTDFTADALAALAYLRQRPDIRPHQVALAGHSEGGLIVWMAAAQPGGPDLAISLAGPGVPGDAILLRQQADLARAAGADSAAIGQNFRLHRALFAELRRQPLTLPTDQLAARLAAIVQQQQPSLHSEQAQKLAKPLTDPWMRYFLTLDPATYLVKVKCPVLALNGANDLQVAADQNLPAIARDLKAAHNKDVTIRTLPQLNHFFQNDPTAKSNYAAIEETFAPIALQAIGDWLAAHTGGKGF